MSSKGIILKKLFSSNNPYPSTWASFAEHITAKSTAIRYKTVHASDERTHVSCDVNLLIKKFIESSPSISYYSVFMSFEVAKEKQQVTITNLTDSILYMVIAEIPNTQLQLDNIELLDTCIREIPPNSMSEYPDITPKNNHCYILFAFDKIRKDETDSFVFDKTELFNTFFDLQHCTLKENVHFGIDKIEYQ